MSARITIPEIAERLSVGRLTIYALLEYGMLPGIRLGKRWIVTRQAYEAWERTAGSSSVVATASRSNLSQVNR